MVKLNQLVEEIVLGKVVNAMLDDGFRIEISDQDGGGLYIYGSENGGEKLEDGYKFWVKLTPGNGKDILCDYSTNLESLLAPINAFVDLISDQACRLLLLRGSLREC